MSFEATLLYGASLRSRPGSAAQCETAAQTPRRKKQALLTEPSLQPRRDKFLTENLFPKEIDVCFKHILKTHPDFLLFLILLLSA